MRNHKNRDNNPRVLSCVLTFNINDPTDSTLSTQCLYPHPTTLFNRYLKPTKVLGMEFDEYYPYVDDYVVKNYYLNLFEQACRISQATTVGYNGKVIAPIHSNMCLKMC